VNKTQLRLDLFSDKQLLSETQLETYTPWVKYW